MEKTKVETINEAKAEVKAGWVQLYNLCASASIPNDPKVEEMQKYHILANDILRKIDSKIATIQIMC